jgi:hypothetical protein
MPSSEDGPWFQANAQEVQGGAGGAPLENGQVVQPQELRQLQKH